MNIRQYDYLAPRLSRWFGGSSEVWFQRLNMIGSKHAKNPELIYFGLMFYFFAIFWNNVHPDMYYGGGDFIPWHGFTICWGPNATGEPGQILWKRKKLIQLWR